MDLPTCPSCRQSVLDDEAETCPFCGASMKARPGAAPVAAPKAAQPPRKPMGVAAPAERTAAKAGKPTAAAGSKESDDPFAAPGGAAAGAIRLSAKPMKGRTFEVVCPMCETRGYAPPQAARKEVRCANPQCLVPVFTAPDPPPEPAPPEPEPARAPVAGLAVAAVALLAGAGFAIWFFMFRDTAGPAEDPPARPSVAASNPTDPSNLAHGQQAPKAAARENTNAKPSVTPEEMRRGTLQRMVSATRDLAPRDVYKPVLVRSAAQAFALAGDLPGAREQIARIDLPDDQWHRIVPLAQIAWRQLASGQDDAARQTVEEALKLAPQVPGSGRDPWETTTVLAAAAAATGHEEDAATLLGRSDNPQDVQRLPLWAEVVSARALQAWNFDRLAENSPALPWARPQPVAVGTLLAAHGRWDDAVRWARRQQNDEVTADVFVALAEAIATRGPQEVERLDAMAQPLSPAARAHVYARAAAHLAAVDPPTADTLLQTAREALDSVAAPEPLLLNGIEEVLDARLDDPDQQRRAAAAAAEIARAEVGRGRAEQAWQSFQRALAHARASGPSPAVTDRLQEELRTGESSVRGELQILLNLKSQDETRRRLLDYRRQLDELAAAARQRLELVSRILSAAAMSGLVEQVADEVESRGAAEDQNRQEPFGRTPVVDVLAAQLDAAGNADRAKAIRGLATAKTAPTAEELFAAAVAQVAAGNPAQAARALETAKVDSAVWQRAALRVASRLVEAGHWAQAVQFVRAVQDRAFRDDAMRFAAAQAAAGGKAETVWTTIQEPSLKPEERVALGLGLIAGQDAPATPPVPEGTQPAEPTAAAR